MLVGSSLVPSRISRNMVWPPDRSWPYGYEGQEVPYVLFRSLVLLGVIGFGVGSSCSTLIDWWRGNSIAPLHLEPVALYTALMTALCGLLAWRHRRDWRRTGRVPLLLLTEARNARIDAVITLATGSGPAGIAAALGKALVCPCANHRCPAGAGGEPGLASRTAGGAAGCHAPGRGLCR